MQTLRSKDNIPEKFMEKMEHWIRALVESGIKIGDFEKIFGSKSSNPITNRTIIAIIQIISKNRQKEKNTTLKKLNIVWHIKW